MATQEVAIRQTVNITLKSDTEMLDDVVVVAYGTAKKSSFTGSATAVSGEKIAKMQVSSVSKALEGAAAVSYTHLFVTKIPRKMEFFFFNKK